jgi:hypothetical protein
VMEIGNSFTNGLNRRFYVDMEKHFSVINMRKSNLQKLKNDKVVGYVLLIVGLILVFFAIRWAYSGFTSGSSPLSIFRWENQSVSISQGDNNPPQHLDIPGDQISKTVNYGLFLSLVVFLVWAGVMIANIGVKLIRDIKVVIKK